MFHPHARQLIAMTVTAVQAVEDRVTSTGQTKQDAAMRLVESQLLLTGGVPPPVSREPGLEAKIRALIDALVAVQNDVPKASARIK